MNVIDRILFPDRQKPILSITKLFTKAIVYLKVHCNLKLPEIGLLLAPYATPESLEHDSENVYEWMWLNLAEVPFALNVTREHGWADIDDDTESTASAEELEALVKPGPVYLFGWDRSTDSYVDELPEWLPQFVADHLKTDVFICNGRINVEIPDGEPVAQVRPQREDRK